MLKNIVQIFIVCMPWTLKRLVLQKWYGFSLDKTSYIGLSWVFPGHLEMEGGASIGHLNVIINLDSVYIGKNSVICRRNWITGFSSKSMDHFAHESGRKASLILKRESAITKNHHIDCTNTVTIGEFTTIAGYYSQFLSHSIDIYENRQSSKPITIGDYCFVGTNCIVLGGAVLPDHSVLGANATLQKKFTESFYLYGGVPAVQVKKIDESAKYFHRESGFVA